MALNLRSNGNVVYTDYGRQCAVPFKTPEAREVERIFFGLPPGIEPFLWFTGADYFQSGSYQASTQAEAIFSVGHYLFFGDPSKQLPPLGFGYEKEREWVIENTLWEETRMEKQRNWSQRASRCVPVMLDSTETSQLRASLVALMSFLMTAPTRRDATQIKLIVDQIREELLIRTLGPMSD